MSDSVNDPGNDPVNDYIIEAQDLQVHFPLTTGLLEKTVSHVKSAGANGGTHHYKSSTTPTSPRRRCDLCEPACR
jgi:hypothetical protein